MKTTFISFRSLLIIATLTFGLAACNKENVSETEEESFASQDLSVAAVEDDNVTVMADQVDATGSFSNMRIAPDDGNTNGSILGSCAVITHDTLASIKKITIDFGSGCTGPNGVIRKGKIIIAYTGRYRAEGTIIHITTEDYFVNDNKVEIDKTIKNLGKNNKGNFVFHIESSRAVKYPNGKMSASTAVKTREWLEGASTPLDFSDDVYRVETEGAHVSRNGIHYTFRSLTALIRNVSCKEFVSGELKIVRKTGNNRYSIINFGTGDCDDTATVTLDNGRSFTIDLKH